MKTTTPKYLTEISSTESVLPNYAEALRLLKNTEMMLQKKKKQLRVQGVKSQRGSWIEQEQEHRKKLKQDAKAQNQQILREYQALKMKQLQKIETLRKQSEKARQQNIKNRSKSKLQIIQNKIRMREQIRQKSLEHQQKVKQFRREILQRKQHRWHELYSEIKSSRIHVSDYQKNYITEARNLKSRERDDLMEKVRKRQKEIEEINQQLTNSNSLEREKQVSTTDIKVREQLPYSQRSSYLKGRKKSVSDTKLDTSKNQLLLIS